MRNWRKWIWPGLLVVLLLTAVSTWYRADQVELDLSSKALTGLSANHSWATVSMDGRDLTLSGTAPSQEAANEAMAIAGSAYDVRVVADATDIYKPPPIPVASPYEWQAEYDGSTVVLSGHVSGSNERTALLDEITSQLPGAKIADKMQVATGAPDDFDNAMSFGVGFLSKFEKGRVALKDNHFSVSGYSSSSANYMDANALVAKLPAGYQIAENSIQPVGVSPYTWSANHSETGLVLGGHVPGEPTRIVINEAAGAAFPGISIMDNMLIAGGASSQFEAAVLHGLEMLKHFETGEVGLLDGGFSVRGRAKSLDDYDAALEASKNLPEGITSRVISLDPPVVSPYQLSAVKSGDSVTLNGYMPSTAIRVVALAALKKANPDANIIDNTRIASGVTPGLNWADASSFALKMLGNLKSGSVSIKDGKFSIEGAANSAAVLQSASETINAGVGGGMELASKNITAPLADPYLWMVNKYGSAVTVAGHVADRKSGDALVELVKRATGVDTVSDLQGIAGGKPDGFDAVRELAIGFIGRLEASEAILSNKTLTITGQALTTTTRNEIQNALASGLPAGYSADAKITLPDAAETVTFGGTISDPEASKSACQQSLNSSLAKRNIEFEVNRAVIKQVSAGLLDELANGVSSCPDARIEIAGHTDSDGSDAYNQKLSEGRAIAVREYLVRAGVVASRLDAKGYGESRPLADNSTEEGRARNRRIELNVIQ